MKKVLLAALMAGISQPAMAQIIVCDGTESTGSGNNPCGNNLLYVYDVTAPTTDLYIGTDDGNLADYTNICMPANWIFTIETNANEGIEEYTAKTAHGTVSPGFAHKSRYVIHFSDDGTGQIATWRFGYDNPNESHDVGWRIYPGTTNPDKTVWTSAVGIDDGPVHAPWVPVPTVSEWGLVVMTLLVLAAGTVVLRRRRAMVA